MMETDSPDPSGGIGETMNGHVRDHKTDMAKAIIKQDVMLSGSSNQSPLSSVPLSLALSNGGLSVSALTTSLAGAFGDGLFLGSLPSLALSDHMNGDLYKHELGGILSSQHSQLFSQPSQILLSAGQAAAAALQAQSVPAMQQLLIPVSLANGTQQLLSIPLSLAAANQIQLLSTANGQLLATANFPNLTPAQLNVMSLTDHAAAFGAQAKKKKVPTATLR